MQNRDSVYATPPKKPHQFISETWAQLNPDRLNLTMRSYTDHSRAGISYNGLWNFNGGALFRISAGKPPFVIARIT